jgi:calcineurin-like phosphoesterase family protein
MVDTWFTSDFHFGHFNIIRYCNRPFESTEEMDAHIADRMNAHVKPNDTLYFLGDFCMGSVEKVAAYRKRLNCKTIHFVEGNHDKVTRKPKASLLPGVPCPKSMWASKESFFAITRCASGRILGAAHGSSMATPTATCPTNHCRYRWMLELIRTIIARGTLMKYRRS